MPCRPNALFGLAVLVALAAPASATAAGTLHVDAASTAPAAACGTEAAPCATIADALARATGGELVLVAPGSYDGATIDQPVHLRGAHAGTPGDERGAHAGPESTIRSALVVRATASIDGFTFDAVADGPAVRFVTTGGGRIGASVVEHNRFTDIRRDHVIGADASLAGLRIADNLFDGSAGTAQSAVVLHGELIGGIDDLLVERNTFAGYSHAVLDLGGVPGAKIRDNVARDNGSLLALSSTDGSLAGPVVVSGNHTTGHAGPALRIGAGVIGLRVEANEMHTGAAAALQLDDLLGGGSTRDVLVRGNDLTGFSIAIDATGAAAAGTLVVRGNRLVDVRRGGATIDNRSTATIDARRNWWGRSSGPGATDLRGSRIDAGEPLRLVGVEAPGTLLAGGSGVVAVRLVGPIGGEPEAAAGGFPVLFHSTHAAVEHASVPMAAGRASTLLHVGEQAGSTTTIATLDEESVWATTRIVAAGGQVDDTAATPSVAESRVPPNARYRVRTKPLAHTLRFSLTRGFKHHVRSNYHASLRATYFISHHDARRLGLRARSNRTRQPFIIARVRTRPIRGQRVVTAPVNPRPAFALRRANRRIAVYVQTVMRTRDGQARHGYRRIVLPANAI